MTLRDLVNLHPNLFYLSNAIWWEREPFVDEQAHHLGKLTLCSAQPTTAPRYSAADLALAYVQDPDSLLWRKFMWTADTDRYGHAVYVGGVGEYGIDRWQIHRRLTPDCYWPRVA
jgi:hypothetical protein